MRQSNEDILESLDNGLAVVDADRRVIRWNRPLEHLSGIPRKEAVGRRLAELLSPSLVDSIETARQGSPSGAALYRVPLTLARGHAETGRLVDVVVVPLQGDDGANFGVEGSIVVCEDVASRPPLQEQLQVSHKMASIGVLAAGPLTAGAWTADSRPHPSPGGA